jgi:hypothetical protein
MAEAVGDPALDELWRRVLEAWNDEKRHGALLELALRTQALAAVAARYRTLVDDPEKGARARQKLEGVATAATNLLFSTRTPRARRRVPIPITLSAFATCALLLVWLVWALWGAR